MYIYNVYYVHGVGSSIHVRIIPLPISANTPALAGTSNKQMNAINCKCFTNCATIVYTNTQFDQSFESITKLNFNHNWMCTFILQFKLQLGQSKTQ